MNKEQIRNWEATSASYTGSHVYELKAQSKHSMGDSDWNSGPFFNW